MALVVFAVVLALIFGVRYLGLWQGQNATPAAKAGAATVAAVIVDPAALNANTAAIEAMNVEQHEANMIARRQADATEDLAKATGALRDQLVFVAAKMK